MNGRSTILEVRQLTRRFGGLLALSEVDFTAAAGQITSLIGPNGAGKTTCLNVISGVYPASGGLVRFQGREITGLASHRIAGCGMTRTFQNLQVFRNMTVLENVMVGMHTRTRSGFIEALVRSPRMRREEKTIRQAAHEALAFFGLEGKATWESANLPYGDQKRVEMARAMVARPDLILLDEPAAGLNTRETRDMGLLIHKLKASGIAILLVEHDMDLVMEISDHVVVLNHGQHIAAGAPRQIQNDPNVIAAYLGATCN